MRKKINGKVKRRDTGVVYCILRGGKGAFPNKRKIRNKFACRKRVRH